MGRPRKNPPPPSHGAASLRPIVRRVILEEALSPLSDAIHSGEMDADTGIRVGLVLGLMEASLVAALAEHLAPSAQPTVTPARPRAATVMAGRSDEDDGDSESDDEAA